jgi:predicted nuclease of predicted toxin-antitoxin system
MRLLLDEHYSPRIARALRDRGHDVIAVGERADLAGVDDAALLQAAADEHRALVTNNVADLVVAARERTAGGQTHAGLVLTSDRSLPRTRAGIGAIVAALDALLATHLGEEALADRTCWLSAPRE